MLRSCTTRILPRTIAHAHQHSSATTAMLRAAASCTRFVSTSAYPAAAAASASATSSSASSSSAATPSRPSGHRADRPRYHYVRKENSATYQASRNATLEEKAKGVREVPVHSTPIDVAIEADAAAASSANSSSSELMIPEGSVAYSGGGRSHIPIAPIPEHLFKSRAGGRSAFAKKMELAIAPQKLNDICRTVRGLSVQEALIQLKISQKKKAWIVRTIIASAMSAALQHKDMEKSRLYVDQIWVGHGTHLKRLDIKGRGRTGMKRKRRSNIFCVIKEQSYDPDTFHGEWKLGGNSHDPRTGEELRIGRVGRKISTIERTLKHMKEWRLERGMKSQVQTTSGARIRNSDGVKAFRAAGQKTDIQAIFGKAAIQAAEEEGRAAREAWNAAQQTTAQ